jgi:hypothetical protein
MKFRQNYMIRVLPPGLLPVAPQAITIHKVQAVSGCRLPLGYYLSWSSFNFRASS